MDNGAYSRSLRYLAYFCLIYFAFFVGLDLFRLWGYGYDVVDLGVYHQMIWNNSRGDFFDCSLIAPYDADSNCLRLHFSILLSLVVTPIYWVFSHIETLLVVHVFACTIAAFPIFFAAKQLKLAPNECFFWAFVYLINQLTLYHTMFSLQDVSLAVPLIATGMWAVLAKRFRVLLLISIGLILAKEHFGVTVFGFGLLWALYHKEWKKGAILALLGLAAFYIIVFMIMPIFTAENAHMMIGAAPVDSEFKRYQWLSLPLPQLMEALPQVIFNNFNYVYAKNLLLPFLALPLVALIFVLPAGADVALTILSTFLLQKSITFYYAAPVAPVLTVAACYACYMIGRRFKLAKTILLMLILLMNIYLGYQTMKNPITKLSLALRDKTMDWGTGEQFAKLQNHIADDKKLISFGTEGVLLTNRRVIYSTKIESSLKSADAMVMRLNPIRMNYYGLDANYNLASVNAENYTAGRDKSAKMRLEMLNNMLNSPKWGVTYFDFPWILFEKGAEDKYDIYKVANEVSYYLDFYYQTRKEQFSKGVAEGLE